jgi:hypothetical protein
MMEYRNRYRADDEEEKKLAWATIATCTMLSDFGDARPVL